MGFRCAGQSVTHLKTINTLTRNYEREDPKIKEVLTLSMCQQSKIRNEINFEEMKIEDRSLILNF